MLQHSHQSPNWKKSLPFGTRRSKPNGRVIKKVGKEHHLADKDGWACEARLVMEQVIGRRLLWYEDVLHEDGNRENNAPSNLKLADALIAPALRSRKKPVLRDKQPDLLVGAQFLVLTESLRKRPPPLTQKQRRSNRKPELPRLWLERILIIERCLSRMDVQLDESNPFRVNPNDVQILADLRKSLNEMNLTTHWYPKIEKWLFYERLRIAERGRHAAPRGISLKLWRAAVAAVDRSLGRLTRWWDWVFVAEISGVLPKEIAS